jgi:hypothetical protein
MESYDYPDSSLYKVLKENYNPENDALDETAKMATLLDEFFENNSLITHEYYKPMEFKGFLIIKQDGGAVKEKKKSFFSKLFK